MTKKILAALSLVGLLYAPAALAQDGGMVRVVTVHVQLGHQQHYETLIPKLWEAVKKAGLQSPIFVSAGISDPSAYTYVLPIASFADIDGQDAVMTKAFAAAPDLAEIFAVETSTDQSVWRTRPDLSYVPATPRLSMEEQGFGWIAFLYAVPGQVMALEAELKARAALRKKHGITDGAEIAQMVLGDDGPVYAVLAGAKDEADYYTQAAKNRQKMGAEWQASLTKTGPMLRRVEYSTSRALPALSFQP